MKHFRPLSESMIQKLKRCREVALDRNNVKHCTMEEMTYAVAPLYKRGLIDIKESVVDNKVLQCIYITQAGIEFLDKLESE